MSSYSRVFARTATATASMLLLGGLVSPAGAFLSGFPDSPSFDRPSDAGRPASGLQRPMRPRAPMPAMRQKGNETSAPAAANDVAEKAKGPLHIIVSLDKQQLTLYSGSEAIAHTRVSTGQRGYATPTGVFSVIQKDRWHRSNLYEDAPMYYMQRITWSGVALHQGVVPNHPASHGCIRMPASFAHQLWAITKLGARVIVAHGQVAPVEIAHARLFTPKPVASRDVRPQTEAVLAAEQAWTFAQSASEAPLAGATTTDVPAVGLPEAPAPDAPKSNAPPLKPGPISVFVSRKEGKLFVRKGFEPVFESPVTIEHPEAPLGTHVFTAIRSDGENQAMRWTVVSMNHAAAGTPSSAASALDRITIPQDALDQISEMMSVGASLIVSDQGLGPETGKGTDFTVLTK